MKKSTGRLFTIEWSNPNTEPPAGAPRVLCEVFTFEQHPPAEYKQFKWSLGGGYSSTIRFVSPPGKKLPRETLATVRRKRLARRVNKKVPLFAAFFIQQELDRKPDYYDGVTDAKLEQRRDAVENWEQSRWLDCLSRMDQVIVHAVEPDECRQRAERLLAETAHVRERLAEKAGERYGSHIPAV